MRRLAFILKAYITNFGDFQRKYMEVKERLESLSSRSKAVKRNIQEMLKVVSFCVTLCIISDISTYLSLFPLVTKG